jgi:hypothetical protein
MAKKIKYLNITVPMTEQDCEDIAGGGEFQWVFHTEDPTIRIKTRIVNEDNWENENDENESY